MNASKKGKERRRKGEKQTSDYKKTILVREEVLLFRQPASGDREVTMELSLGPGHRNG